MSSLSSSSTRAEIVAAYRDNASYAEDNSVDKAKAFVTACRFLIQLERSNIEHLGGTRVETDVSVIADQLRDAQRWLAANAAGGGGVRHADLRNFRD